MPAPTGHAARGRGAGGSGKFPATALNRFSGNGAKWGLSGWRNTTGFQEAGGGRDTFKMPIGAS